MGIKDSALKISGSVLKKMVEKEQQKKPGCMGFLHQPKRPAALKKTKKGIVYMNDYTVDIHDIDE